ncbi:MAG: alpha/beta hydrolase [Rhodobacteraceae bacterium]|nr:alpha/beta hydrolase [Paracoccaceae bacterium]
MPEVIFPGPDGRLEGRYHEVKEKDSPIALILHPDPRLGVSMNNRVVYELHHLFHRLGFSVLRFNFRGVGRSQGAFDEGIGELSDAAAALDFLQAHNPDARQCWIAGFAFGAWIGMQLLMRRPEISGFVSVAPPANMYDFSFLAPCPSSGLVLNGVQDRIVPPAEIEKFVNKLKTQKGIVITHTEIEGANHVFENRLEVMIDSVEDYMRARLGMPPRELEAGAEA